MLMVVPAALGSAGLANLGAERANLLSVVRPTAHIASGRPADFCAVFIQPDALRHQLDVLLVQARVAAVLAFLATA